MINKASKLRLVILTALFTGLLPALAQVAPTGAGETTAPAAADRSSTAADSRDDDRRHRERRSYRDNRRGERNNGEHDRERGDRRRHDPEAFRQLMKAELGHIPSLYTRMHRLMDIQARRFELQKQRLAVARSKGDNRETTIRKFHGLLKQDHDLSDEARAIVQEIAGDMQKIQGELDRRRTILNDELERANSQTTDTETSSPEARELRRRMRYVDYLEKKLGDLQTHPDRLDLFARVLRGLPFDDPSSGPEHVPDGDKTRAATPQERLAELRLRRQILQRELREVELEIEELRRQGADQGQDDGSSAGKENP